VLAFSAGSQQSKGKMKTAKRFRKYRRGGKGGMFYLEDNDSGEQRSLHTKNEAEAEELLEAENKASRTPRNLNLDLGKAFLRNADEKATTRKWNEAMAALASRGKPQSQDRCRRAFEAEEFDAIRNKPIVDTTEDHFKKVLRGGGNATNNYLRRLHNLVLRKEWLFRQIVKSEDWPPEVRTPKRGITLEEHNAIIESERNAERRDYYVMCWLLGASQTDTALLAVDNIDWKARVLSYQRSKNKGWSRNEIGAELEAVLKRLPATGLLFPNIAKTTVNARSAEFCRRRRLAGVKGVSLHCYRYGLAERHNSAGTPERFAQAGLGHKSRAVHNSYARNAIVICPALETTNIVQLPSAMGREEIRKVS
jgi:integrase